MAHDRSMYSYAMPQWFKDENNMVILSAKYIQKPNLIKMLSTYAINIWLLIALTILAVTLTHYLSFKLLKGVLN
jgi:hypothetical protein